MPSFPLAPGRYRYRPLKRGDAGWDVYALQTGLVALAYLPATAGGVDQRDGVFGPRTLRALQGADGSGGFQRGQHLAPDGVAGILTQRSLFLAVGAQARGRNNTPTHLIQGVGEFEPGYQIGVYTALYSDGTRDIGCVQKNTSPSVDALNRWFRLPESLDYYAQQLRRNVHNTGHDYFLGRTERGSGKTIGPRRAWELAVGWWHRPAYANWLGDGRLGDSRQPSAWQRQELEDYQDRVLSYCSDADLAIL